MTEPVAERAPVEDSSQVATARAMAVRTARQCGVDERRVDSIALVATELAENLYRHGVQGELVVVRPPAVGAARLSLLAIDRGPGVERFADCLVDGYSTGGTMGTGLGAVQRAADDFDAVSEPGLGTVVSAGFLLPGRTWPAHFDIGAMGFPVAGETRNGDAFATVRVGARIVVVLADGLGHGHGAADASEAVTALLPELAERAPADLLTAVNERIAGTRGAAVSVASLDLDVAREGGLLASAGLGNVAIAGVRPDGLTRRIATAHGTAGTHLRGKIVEQHTEFPAHGLLVLHTDGLTTRWSLDGRVELLRHRAEVVAAALWRDFVRGSDDSLVVVVRATRPTDGSGGDA